MAKLTSLEKYRIIEPILNKRATIVSVSKLHKIPTRTLRHWQTIFNTNGIDGLNRKKRVDSGKQRKIPKIVESYVEAFLLQKPPLSIKNVYLKVAQICKRESLPTPSYNWVYQYSKTISPALLTLSQKGSKAYKQQFELLHRNECGLPNELWQSDHTLLDIWVINPKGVIVRPWLTTVLDDFSRAICGYFLSEASPNATNTALALRQAIWSKKHPQWKICGIPNKLYTDNGSDFTSDHILQVCLKLKIELIHSLPGNPRGRGKVERFFETLNKRLLETMPGYSKHDKPSSTPTLTLSQFESKLDEFIIMDYNNQSKKGKLSPCQLWQGNDSFLPQMPSSLEDLDNLMLHVDKIRKIQRDGIRFLGLRYISLTLVAFVGEYVIIKYDPRDLAEIKVYFSDGNFLCKAICQDIADLTVSMRELLSARKTFKKQLDDKIKDAKMLLRHLTNQTPTTIHEKKTSKSSKKLSSLKIYNNE